MIALRPQKTSSPAPPLPTAVMAVEGARLLNEGLAKLLQPQRQQPGRHLSLSALALMPEASIELCFCREHCGMPAW